jgi:hypothetical protein
MRSEKAILSLLVLSILLLSYIAFYIPYKQKARAKECMNIAITFEKARHYPVDDLTVTNQDISSFQKNMLACITD